MKLSERVEKLEIEQAKSNVFYGSWTVWNLDQVKKVIADNDMHNEIIKVEITHGSESRALRPCYKIAIWKYNNYL